MNTNCREFRTPKTGYLTFSYLRTFSAILLIIFSGLAQSANSQILTPKKEKGKKNTRVQTLRPGEILDYRIDPSDSTKNSLSMMRPNKLMFADCSSRGRYKGMWLLDEKGDTVQHVSSRGGHASWSTDHARMVCIDPRLNLKILDLGNPGKGIVIKTPNHLTPEMPAWSPKADVIAFGAVDKFDIRQIYIVDANEEASGLKQLTQDTLSSYMPTWSADGKSIIFSRHQGEKGLYVISTSGGEAKPFFVADSVFVTETILSPDGKYLVGTDRTSGNILRLDADGTNPLNLTKAGTAHSHFGNSRFIDNGARVIFAGRTVKTGKATLLTISINPKEGEKPVEFRKPDGLTFTYASPNF